MANGKDCLGRLVVSVDVAAETSKIPPHAHPARPLADWAISSRTIVTWGFDDPGSPFAAWLAAADPQQEIGLLARHGTDRQPVLRGELSRRLDRQIAAARKIGATPRSVLFTGLGRPEQLDVLAQYELTAARGVRHRPQPDGVWTRARNLRHGVWEIPPSAWIAGRQSFFTRFVNTRRARKMVLRSAAEGGAVHLVVHAAGLAQAASGALMTLSDVARTTAALRAEGRLYSVSLSSAVAALAPRLQTRSSRSILRPAA